MRSPSRWRRSNGCKLKAVSRSSSSTARPLIQRGTATSAADALAQALDAHQVIVCPAFPATGRSIYQGHLFVNGVPLHESGMQNHPLTPMTDSDLRRWLTPQSQFEVGHVSASAVFEGSTAIAAALQGEHRAGKRLIVVDAIRDEDLFEIGKAASGLPLITGGSGVALGLPSNFGCVASAVPWRGQSGKCVALSGSCSEATRGQVAHHAAQHPAREIDAAEVINGRLTAAELTDWLLQVGGDDDVPLAYSSADPSTVAKVQETFGRDRSSTAIEEFFAEVARLSVAAGVSRIITAGGETSGAIVEGPRFAHVGNRPRNRSRCTGAALRPESCGRSEVR